MMIRFGQDSRKFAARLFRIPVILVVLCAFSGTAAHAIPINAVNISADTSTGVISSSNLVAGWLFTAEQNIAVTALGMWDNGLDGFLQGSVLVGLWDTGGNLLASTSVSSSDTAVGGFRFAAMSPLSLLAGTQYVIGGLLLQPDIYRKDATITSTAGVTWIESRAKNSSTLVFPDAFTVNDGYFGANFQYEAVPTPATLTLFGLGLVGLGWSRRKKT